MGKNSDATTKPKTLKPADLRKLEKADPAIHAGAMRLAGKGPDDEMTQAEYKKMLDRFHKGPANAKRR